MTAEIITFETPEMAVERRSRAKKHCTTVIAGNCRKRLASGKLSPRAKLENMGLLALVTDDHELAWDILAKI